MSWLDWLSQDELGALCTRYPTLSFREMAVEAMRRPGYAERFAELDASIVGYNPDWATPQPGLVGFSLANPADYPAPHFPEETEQACAQLIALALLGDEQADTPPGEATEEEVLAEGLDLGGEGYTDDEMGAVVRLCRERRLHARRLEAEGRMSLRRALRVWHWFQPPVRAARWSAEDGLHAAPGFQWIARETPKGRRWTLVRTR